MKRIVCIVAAVMCFATALRAQEPTQAKSLDLYKIGKNWGSRGQWQFGIDKGLTLGGCIQRELHDGQWLAGPCRDVFVLARDGYSMIHLGAYVNYNAERGNASYGPRLGVSVGRFGNYVLEKASESVPWVEHYASWKAPPFMQYLGSIMTLDYGVGYRPVHTSDVIGNWTHGPMFKLDIPIDDIYALLIKGL